MKQSVEDKILFSLIGASADARTIESQRQLLQAGLLEGIEVQLDVPAETGVLRFNVRDTSPSQGARMLKEFGEKASRRGNKGATSRRVPVSQARTLLEEQETERLMREHDVVKEAIETVEQNGIVFIDEIDKIVAASGEYRRPGASDEGVQRDLLPIIEGSTVTTPHGNVNTDFILFIASGAFHSSKPSDLLAELQGRLPIRVHLKGLTEDDLYRILTEPVSNLIRQQVEMLRAERLDLVFTDEAIREIARVASEVP